MVVVNILDGLALTKFVVKPVLVTIFQKKILREKKMCVHVCVRVRARV